MAKKGRKGSRTYASMLKKCLRSKIKMNEEIPSQRMSRCHEQIREGKSVGMWR